MAKVASIKHYDIANGEGIRTSIFFSGCEHHCKNCFNSELWSFDVGEEFDYQFYKTKIKPTINEHIAGISILGGEPFHPNNMGALFNLINWFKEDFPDKTIWCWTGYTYENLKNNYRGLRKSINNSIFKKIDVLVDGKFIEEQKDLTLKWKGSKNQRVIDMKETIKQDRIVLYG